MISDILIKIKTNSSNYRHYIEKGYLIEKCGIEIEINVLDLPLSSHMKINCKCDKCGINRVITYNNYIRASKINNQDVCVKCCGNKSKLTSKKKYGDLFQSTPEFKEKIKNIVYGKYGGKEGYSKFISDISKEKCQEKYGVNSVMQLKEFQEKSKQGMLDKYGVEYPMQNEFSFNKAQKTGLKLKEYNGLKYQGTYELDFLKFCKTNNFKVERGKSIKFIMDSKNKTYYPDFYLPEYNLICEIKSDYYYYKYLDKNLSKMETSIERGFQFKFILNKNYEELYMFCNKS
jgi:hypothetical protein